MRPIFHLDATYSVGKRPTGVANYSREILFGLAAAHPEERFRFCFRPHRYLGAFDQNMPSNVRRVPLLDHLVPVRPQLFHGLNQRLPKLRMKRAVSTFHDLFVMTSEYSTPAFRERFTIQARDAATRSDLVICVSSFTAMQAEELLGVPRSRLRVVHHGVRPPDPAAIPPPSAREPLILFVGAIQKRKNVAGLVRAFARVPAPWKLTLVGSRGYGWEEVEIAVAESPARDRICVSGYCDDESLRSLYARASIFAFPSLDEGFGIPILEAMAWGVPVISSSRSSMPEVAGDAAVLIDPLQPSQLEDALISLVEQPSQRETLASLGRVRARNFTWERAVEHTYDVYQELLGEPG